MFSAIWTQFFPPRNGAPLTEANLPSQAGRVFVVTGASSGLGYELSRILYGAGGNVYMLTRSQEHADEAVARIKAHYQGREPQGGSLAFIYMDLTDLETVKAAAQDFIERQGPDGRLDVLFNNAGTAARPKAPATRQGHEYHFGVNSLGGFLLARLLTPILARTAKLAPASSVRVVWPASCLVEMMTPDNGIRSEFLRDPASVTDENELYSSSKAASWFVASEFARRQPDGVVHIAGNPGNYLTNIWRDTPAWLYWLLWPILRDPIHGAETYLFMAFSGAVTLDDAVAGRYVICDGRWHPGQRKDLLLALRSVDEGGSGRASAYFDWCEDKVRGFVIASDVAA
ncbi:hypothetical protein HIM_08282 [Hirsutella minnesotensis 3608]|uniref:Uncharacterized protein n=1 Tax=Hirsutella minnesotensis 3608 TaxID=1043627 RepID=A0A0F7ZHB6_9HYPO|nr:hypothetical protein HIM_08282 [Hirsutella minnesotensis 3608]